MNEHNLLAKLVGMCSTFVAMGCDAPFIDVDCGACLECTCTYK